MKLGFKIAVRFLKSNKGQTALIVVGIAVAVAVQIFIGSLIQSLQTSLIDSTIGNSSQITVYSEAEDGVILDYQNVLSELQDNYSEITAISAVSDQSVLMEIGDQSQSLLIRGMEADASTDIYEWQDAIIEGSYPEQVGEILLGESLKQDYNLALNDEITVVKTDGTTQIMRVSGFFDLKVEAVNSSWAITTLDSVENLFSTEDIVNSIEMQLNSDTVFDADVTALEMDTFLEAQNLYTENWKDANESLLSGLQGQSVSSIMIQVFVMVSVVLGISSVLAITVIQKSRQIGILKAMGLKNRTASYVFLSEGLMIGLVGAALGILLGVGLGLSFTTFVRNSDGTAVIDITISSSFIILSGFIAIGASLFASLIPAIKSTKLNPIDIIRNN